MKSIGIIVSVPIWAGLLVALSACGSPVAAPPALPVVQTLEVKVPVPVPCKALDELRAEPTYADTPNAVAGAANIFERVSLLLSGRAQRDARLAEYIAAKRSC